jgi:hypothetical protein
VVPLQGTFTKDCKSGYNKDSCTAIFIAALFTTARLWRQPRCPTTDEQIKKTWCRYMSEYYSDIEKTKIVLFAGKWMELEDIVLSNVSQVQKDKGLMFSLVCERYIQKINIYTQTNITIYIYIENVFVIEELRGRRKRKRDNRESATLKYRRSVQADDLTNSHERCCRREKVRES